MDAVFTGAKWKKSIKSGMGNCVEVARSVDGDWIGVRDSKNPTGLILKFRPGVWRGFLADIKTDNSSD